MPCPLCDHTLQNLGLDTAGRRTFWCPRCGTLKTVDDDGSEYISSPYMATRLLNRQFREFRNDVAAMRTAQQAAQQT
jgi:hypothetical protein